VGYLTLGWFHVAVAVRITGISNAACTGGQMVCYTAVRIAAAGAWTGIATLLLLARLIRGAVRVAYALRTTRLIRVTKMIRQALAGTDAISFAAHSIRATGIGLAGSHLLIDNAFYGRVNGFHPKREG